MRTTLVITAIALAALIAVPSIASQPESFTVNGLKVIFVNSTATQIVAANMYFRGGAPVLDTRQAGIEELALAVATKASSNYPKDRLHAALERMDTRLTSVSAEDYSSVNLQCVKQNLSESWKIFTDVLLSPAFNAGDVEIERNQALAAIRQSRDNPDQYLNELASRAFYIQHPYGTSVRGTAETVARFTTEDLRAYYQGRLSTSQMLLVVVGNITRAELENLVRSSFAAVREGGYAERALPDVHHDQPSIKVVKRDLPTNYITGLFPIPATGTTDWYPMRMAISRLGQRLFEEVRTKRGLSYAPAAFTGQNFSNYGAIYVTAVAPDTTIKVMLAEVKRLQDEPVPEKDLHDLANQFLTGYYLNMETNASQADLLARYELIGRGYEEAGKLMERLQAVTPDVVQKVCREYMHNLQYVILGNPQALQISAFMY